ncbi:hypothetical protein [Paenibacillus nasutitermitis]|uniref:hypothetical protein n=1 Tax=Paenibacillus nasutitermitis TaxID=1652958 RepID=UPI001662C407|nr:hypothetical protein [Paenibacillus nasutitermitis]
MNTVKVGRHHLHEYGAVRKQFCQQIVMADGKSLLSGAGLSQSNLTVRYSCRTLFANASSGDFYLKTGTEAIDAGNNLSSSSVVDDWTARRGQAASPISTRTSISRLYDGRENGEMHYSLPVFSCDSYSVCGGPNRFEFDFVFFLSILNFQHRAPKTRYSIILL